MSNKFIPAANRSHPVRASRAAGFSVFPKSCDFVTAQSVWQRKHCTLLFGGFVHDFLYFPQHAPSNENKIHNQTTLSILDNCVMADLIISFIFRLTYWKITQNHFSCRQNISIIIFHYFSCSTKFISP